MLGIETNKIESLLQLPRCLSLMDFDNYILEYLDGKNDKKIALQELDKTIAILQNYVLLLSIFLKQNHLLAKTITDTNDTTLYTKQEIANKYRVSVRTVNNWILDGLQTVEIGGIKRIDSQSIQEYKKRKRRRKFNWKSHTIPSK